MLFDNLYDTSGVTLTGSEKKNIVADLEHVLQVTTDQEQSHFDPWAAQGAAERLERHYRRIGQIAEVHRVVRAYGKAFENAAKNANALLARLMHEQSTSAGRVSEHSCFGCTPVATA